MCDFQASSVPSWMALRGTLSANTLVTLKLATVEAQMSRHCYCGALR
jgi:hypothetical protein